MIRVFVVDDEALAVRRLVRLLEATGRVTVVGSDTDPESALQTLSRPDSADLLFVDVQMPGLSGFELVRALPRPLPVVFVTAFDQYAVDAFEVNSLDYLLKPVESERLTRTLDRFERSTAGAVDVRSLAQAIASQLASRKPLERLASRTGERTTLLDVARVSHITARDKATYAVVNGRAHPVDQTLATLEASLDPRRFVRIHRGSLVNVAFVQELDAWVDGGVLVRLKDEAKTELPVARDRVRQLKERLGIQ
jgi:two-component system, LytTR family, response regulator